MLFQKTSFFLLSVFLLFVIQNTVAQEDKNQINQLNFSQSDTLSFDEYLPHDEEDVEEIDEDAGADQSMMYIYFNWMPGYGLYSNFDILKGSLCSRPQHQSRYDCFG